MFAGHRCEPDDVAMARARHFIDGLTVKPARVVMERCERCSAQTACLYHDRFCFGCHLAVPVPANERPVTL